MNGVSDDDKVYCANVDVYDFSEPILVMKMLEDAMIGDDVKELWAAVVFYVIVKIKCGPCVSGQNIILYRPVRAHSCINFYILCKSYWSCCTKHVSI